MLFIIITFAFFLMEALARRSCLCRFYGGHMAEVPSSVKIREYYLPLDGVEKLMSGEWIVTPRFTLRREVVPAKGAKLDAIEAGPSFWGAFRK